MRKLAWTLALLLASTGIGTAAPITSSNRDVLLPNTVVSPPGGVVLGGTRFINHGLQGVGRIAANSIDPATGETLGSISDMQITGFQNLGGGTWQGRFEFLPDRGYNAGTTFSNYAARVNTYEFTFTPHTTNSVNTSQDQIITNFVGSTRFTYDHDNNSLTPGVYTTGLLASGVGVHFGKLVPTVVGNTTQSDGVVNNRLTLDAEGFILDQRAGKAGSGWVSDEYGPYIYHFNSNKEIDGVVTLPEALIPHAPLGNTNFQQDPPVNGRRNNQGMEGIAVSPSGNRLFGLLQSATIQDSGAGNAGRSNTRLVVYDVSNDSAPTDPVAQYVIQLPRVDDNGGTPAVNRTAAQSAIIAINDHQILILSRDGNGRGASGSPVFKSVLLADLSTATNIDGMFDAEGNAVAPGGVLNAAVTPISWVEALNMLGKVDLGVTELEQFGLNLLAGPGDINTLSEKWEGLALVSAQDPLAPNDYFLFIGNDNDFATRTGMRMDANGVLQSFDAGIENDTIILAYRVTVVPEPSSLLIAMAGSLGLLMKGIGHWKK